MSQCSRPLRPTTRSIAAVLGEDVSALRVGEPSSLDGSQLQANLEPASQLAFRGRWLLKEYKTHMGSFSHVPCEDLGRATIQHIRSLASGIFSHAVTSLSSSPTRGTMSRTLTAWAKMPDAENSDVLNRRPTEFLREGRVVNRLPMCVL